ncbi:MAG: hypothetical protein KDE15_12430 [Erythrobacter sp.]|nr:hypothetical protein [Erythrobacter sp.]
MKKQILMAALPLFVLAACSDSADEATDDAAADPLAAQAAGTGPYLVTYADGTMSLAYSAADGSEWVGPVAGSEPATWTASDGQVCVDPPGDAEDGSPNVVCVTMGDLNPDGTWQGTPDSEGSEPATMRRLDMTAATPADQVAAGTYLVDLDDGNHALIVWNADGSSYASFEAQHGTWRADGQQRCSKLDTDEAESCGAPTSEMGEDGTFTADDGANGAITVRML